MLAVTRIPAMGSIYLSSITVIHYGVRKHSTTVSTTRDKLEGDWWKKHKQGQSHLDIFPFVFDFSFIYIHFMFCLQL